MKVTVRIHYPTGLEFKTKKVDDDGKVLLRRRSKFQREWRPKIASTEQKLGMFSRVKYYSDIWPEALETFNINAREKVVVEKPELDQVEVTRYAKSKVFEKRYMTDAKPAGSFVLYAILLVQVISMVVTFLLVTGRLRL